MWKKLIASLIVGAALNGSVSAQQQNNDRPVHCGKMPSNLPKVPNGAKATIDEITEARKAIVSYSKEAEAYLGCMEQRIRWYASFMSKEQQTRWDADMVEMNNKLRDLQIKMNEEIRTFRKVNQPTN